MFVLDVLDFRKMSDYPVPVEEHDFQEALVAAGVEFSTPLRIRFRIKDIDPRMLLSRFDVVDEHGDEFRVNIYLPFPQELATEAFWTALNGAIRHRIKHIAQIRAFYAFHGRMPTAEESTMAMGEAMEVEALIFALDGPDVLRETVNVKINE